MWATAGELIRCSIHIQAHTGRVPGTTPTPEATAWAALPTGPMVERDGGQAITLTQGRMHGERPPTDHMEAEAPAKPTTLTPGHMLVAAQYRRPMAAEAQLRLITHTRERMALPD